MSFCHSLCNKDYTPSRFHPKQRTCGDRCYGLLYRRENKTKIAQFNRQQRERRWFGDNREKALIRDGHRCTVCGNRTNLHVHHKDGKGRGYKQSDNNLTNLITLCNPCHQKAHNIYNISNNPKYIDAVKIMSGNGLSTRKIGAYLGISHTTVRVIRNGLA